MPRPKALSVRCVGKAPGREPPGGSGHAVQAGRLHQTPGRAPRLASRGRHVPGGSGLPVLLQPPVDGGTRRRRLRPCRPAPALQPHRSLHRPVPRSVAPPPGAVLRQPGPMRPRRGDRGGYGAPGGRAGGRRARAVHARPGALPAVGSVGRPAEGGGRQRTPRHGQLGGPHARRHSDGPRRRHRRAHAGAAAGERIA